MSTANATATINDRSAWVVGGVGVACIFVSLAMIATTREMWQMQAVQVGWLIDRLAISEREVTTLRDKLVVLEAREDARRRREDAALRAQ